MRFRLVTVVIALGTIYLAAAAPVGENTGEHLRKRTDRYNDSRDATLQTMVIDSCCDASERVGHALDRSENVEEGIDTLFGGCWVCRDQP